MKRFTMLFGLGIMLFISSVAVAAVPQLINFQGKLSTPSGDTVAPGSYNVTFRIWDAASGGTELWNSGVQAVNVTGGLFNTLLSAPEAVFNGDQRWLGITVAPDVAELTPRTQIVSVGFSYRVSSVDSASGGTITSKVSIGPGHTNTGTNAFVAGENNVARGNYSVVGGGGGATAADSNSALGDWSTVSGGRSNAASSPRATVGGGWDNTVSGPSATVGGGQINTASFFAATVGGGAGNTASGSEATVGGGSFNTASIFAATVGGGSENSATDTATTVAGGRNNRARGRYATVGGGGGGELADSNSASGIWSTISGGFRNLANARSATVGGGENNTAGAIEATVGGGFFNNAGGVNATIGGGNSNIASGQRATIGGGVFNRARGDYSVVGGGGGATLADSNSASGVWSTISGGFQNVASTRSATVGGGEDNTASAIDATVSGGFNNTASGIDATVGGGLSNLAADTGTTVAGGRNNRARGRYATVGGGGGATLADSNSALGQWSTVSGGRSNAASSFQATVGGGWDNTASDISATVGGGQTNTASFYAATVGGGAGNTASGDASTIGGGQQDTASGLYSTVPGGFANKASGDYTFAAGRRAKAIHSGAFVWGDNTDANFASTGTNQFLIRATGGVGIGTNTPNGKLHIGDADWTAGPVRITGLPGSSIGPTLELDATVGTAGNRYSLFSTNTGAFAGGGKFAIFHRGPTNQGYRMVIDSTGNVGFGMTTPVNLLDVEGGAAIGAAYSGTNTAPVNGLLVEGGVGIGTSSPNAKLDVEISGTIVARFNRTTNDGIMLQFLQDGNTEGTISVAGTIVSYNAFTGSHYGWTEEQLEKGELVSLTGVNRNSHDNPKAEIIYGIRRSSIPNDPACLGSYLALSESNQPYSSENPHLVMAVGNGDMWVVDEGQNIQPGDYLISSSTPGHAMKDDEEKYPIGHIVARTAEGVDWSTVSEMVGGRKHRKISVLFGNFVRSNPSTVAQTLEGFQEIILKQQKQIDELKNLVSKRASSEMAETER